jgi:hypothetical protein
MRRLLWLPSLLLVLLPMLLLLLLLLLLHILLLLLLLLVSRAPHRWDCCFALQGAKHVL